MKVLVFISLCFLWGFSWVAIKLTLEGIPPFLGAGLRFALALPLLYAYARWKSLLRPVPVEQLRLVIGSAFLIYLVDYGLIYWAEQYLNAGVTAIFFATFPLFTGLFSHFLFRSEPFRINVYIGLTVGLSGVVVLFSDELAKTSASITIVLATLAVVTSAACGALSTVLIKKHLTGVHPVSLSLHQMIWGALGLLIIGALRGEWARLQWTLPSILGLLYLAVLGSAVAFSIYYWLLQKTSAVTVSTMIYITPVVALLSDWAVYGGIITKQAIGGMVLLFCGIAVAEYHKYRRIPRFFVSEDF